MRKHTPQAPPTLDKKNKKKLLCCYGFIFTAENHIIVLIDWRGGGKEKESRLFATQK